MITNKVYYAFSFFISLVLASVELQAQDAEEIQRMSLAECIEYAFKSNASMIDANIDTKIAEATVGEVRAAGLPQINGQIEYTNNYVIQTQFFPATNFDPNASDDDVVAFKFGLPHTGLAALSLEQLVFDGTYFLGLKAADVYTNLSKKAAEVTKAEVALNVTKSYYGVLVTKERLALLDKNIERIKQLLDETKALYDNGFVEELDVDKLTVTHNNLVSERQRLERFSINSLNMLKFTMGMSVVEKIALSDELVTIQMDNQLIEEEGFDYGQRPEYAVYQVQRELDMLDEKRYRMGYYPTLSFFANYGYNGASNTFDLYKLNGNNWNNYGGLGLSLRVPIFDGLRKKYQIQQAQLRLQKTEFGIKQLEKTIDWERITAANTLSNSISTLKAQSENIDLAKKIASKTKIKYKEGVGSSLEVIQAETDLLDAQNSYFSALYDALIAKADYDKAVGKLVSE
ncbi:MAG: TolC family protein [Flammeovirgaceae bacterium]